MHELCERCNRVVYSLEQLKCLDKCWHKNCFKCTQCGITLNLGNFHSFKKMPFCKIHVPELKPSTFYGNQKLMSSVTEQKRSTQDITDEASTSQRAYWTELKKVVQNLDGNKARKLSNPSLANSLQMQYGDSMNNLYEPTPKSSTQKERHLLENADEKASRTGSLEAQDILQDNASIHTEASVSSSVIMKDMMNDLCFVNVREKIKQFQAQKKSAEESQVQNKTEQPQAKETRLEEQQFEHEQQADQEQKPADKELKQESVTPHVQPSEAKQWLLAQLERQPSTSQQARKQKEQDQQSMQPQQALQQLAQQQHIRQQMLEELEMQKPERIKQDLKEKKTGQSMHSMQADQHSMHSDQHSMHSKHADVQSMHSMNSKESTVKAKSSRSVADQSICFMHSQPADQNSMHSSHTDQSMHSMDSKHASMPVDQHSMHSRHTDQSMHSMHSKQSGQSSMPARSNESLLVFEALYNYEARDSDEISCLKGDIIVEVHEGCCEWIVGHSRRTGKSGMLPANYLKRIEHL